MLFKRSSLEKAAKGTNELVTQPKSIGEGEREREREREKVVLWKKIKKAFKPLLA
jgi:hypothetical protein